MNYTGRIHELKEQPVRNFIFDDQYFFYEGGRLYSVDKDKLKILSESQSYAVYIHGLGGIWCDDGNGYKYLDVKGNTNYKKFKDGAIDLFHGNYCVYSFKNEQSNKYNFAIKNLKSNETIVHEDSFNNYTICGKTLLARKTSKGIKCFDLGLNTIWEFKFDRNVDFVYGNLKPFLFQDLVILNIGEEKEGGDGQIIALEKADGSVVWKHHFETEPTFTVIGDRVYATENGRMIVLDAATGNTLVDQPSGFKSSFKGDSLWSNGWELFMVNMTEALIRVFSADGQTLLQELKIPEPFAPLQREHFTNHNGYYYLPLAVRDMCLTGAVYGLLMLRPAKEGDKLEIIIKPRPAHKVLTKQTDDGQDYCHVILNSGSVNEILKYGPILIREFGNVKGAQVWSDNRRNHKFNGRIVFSTNLDDFNNDEIGKIKQMIADIEEYFHTMGIKAGNRKDQINIELGPSPRGGAEPIPTI